MATTHNNPSGKGKDPNGHQIERIKPLTLFSRERGLHYLPLSPQPDKEQYKIL